MDKHARILVAGAHGLVGSAICRRLNRLGYSSVLRPDRTELDYLDATAVNRWFEASRPEYVFMAAARVGGILANMTKPVEFLRDNLIVQINLLDASFHHQIAKVQFLGSSCIYPRLSPQPIREEYLLTGPLEPTNEPYAVAKIAGIRLAQAYTSEYGMRTISLMPTNLYGPGDNFHPRTSHVLPALVRRFHEAAQDGVSDVGVWGTGTPRREFLHVDDLASAAVFLMQSYEDPEVINVGAGDDISIRDLALMIGEIAGFKGRITFDSTKPDGMPRKLLDSSKMRALGWEPEISLRDGIRQTLDWYVANLASLPAGR
ncbi:MAG: GDP-L-fucose synthase [Bryobacteraceae bacterium]|nr:GDP-L-fucose synthase [Bryobacteraceae bacterium]